ncbi:MAG: tetratricopeptide repeat protein, partial [bacterium]
NMVPYHPNNAIRILNRVLLQNPKSSTAYNGKGQAYITLKEYKKAIYNFKKAIALNPKSVSAYNGLGIAYLRYGNKNKGCFYMTKAYKLNSRFKGTLKYFQKKGECPLPL